MASGLESGPEQIQPSFHCGLWQQPVCHHVLPRPCVILRPAWPVQSASTWLRPRNQKVPSPR